MTQLAAVLYEGARPPALDPVPLLLLFQLSLKISSLYWWRPASDYVTNPAVQTRQMILRG